MAERDDRDRPRPPSSPAVSKSPDIEVRVAGDDDGVRHRGAAGQGVGVCASGGDCCKLTQPGLLQSGWVVLHAVEGPDHTWQVDSGRCSL